MLDMVAHGAPGLGRRARLDVPEDWLVLGLHRVGAYMRLELDEETHEVHRARYVVFKRFQCLDDA